VIHHGLDLDAFPIGEVADDYFLFLGRMSPTKGAREAIEIARAAGVRLLIAAKMREPAEYRYFDEQVAPFLGDGISYVGEVGGAEKTRLLGGAKALLNPISWPEPFGLVMIEALACGTPVLTLPNGAAPEIVDDGVEGFTAPVGTIEPLADAIRRLAVDREMRLRMGRAGRARVLREFSVQEFCRQTIEAYGKALEMHKMRRAVR
jgi:glycosyltransferase involved in cell wall biosynthesis